MSNAEAFFPDRPAPSAAPVAAALGPIHAASAATTERRHPHALNLALHGPLDTARLEACLHALRPLPVPVADRSAADGSLERIALPDAAGVDALVSALLKRPLDLDHDGGMRAVLVAIGPHEHRLLWSLHPAVCDDSSLAVLLHSLHALYRAGATPLASPTSLPQPAPPPPAASALHEAALADATARLADAPATLDLPFDHRRPSAGPRRVAGRVAFELPSATGRALRRIARAEGTTLLIALLAAWQTLLQRYSGQSTVLSGIRDDGRGAGIPEQAVGVFDNTLMMRADFSEATTAASLMAALAAGEAAARAHRHLPFDTLLDALAGPHDGDRAPRLLQNMLLTRPPLPACDDGVLRIEPLTVPPTGPAEHELLLELVEQPDDALAGWIEYDADRFESATVERMASHLRRLIEAMSTDPQQPLAGLPLLGDAEALQLLQRSVGPVVPRDPSLTVHALVERQAARTPHATAAMFDGERLSYAELDARAARLAQHLRSLGAGPGSLVGLCMERSLSLVVALLGVLKAGAAFVPLDPEYPPERLAFMLADSAVPLVVVHEATEARLPPADARLVRLEDTAAPVDAEPGSDSTARASPADAAYVIYTSGSSGRPKGVVVAHAAACNNILWFAQALHVGPHDRLLQKTSISFDAAFHDFFAPLITGATVVLAHPHDHRDPAYLVRAMREQEITIVSMVPSALRVLVEEAALSRCIRLRHLVCGGEALELALVRRVRELLPRLQIGNFYGPTEAACNTTHHVVAADLAVYDGSTLPIGRPVDNVRCLVLDSQRRLLPPGVAGELYIGGAGLARGYLERPELDAERFVPDPFRPGERLYRSGDLVRLGAAGDLEFCGRIDAQVKIRGNRIELGEIEAALLRHPGVRQAAVIDREDTPGDRRLVAYLVTEANARAEPDALRQQLRASLPDYMLPARFVVLPALPSLPNGKLDRKALPVPTGEDRRSVVVAPRTRIEHEIWLVWRDLLGTDRFGIQDNFFDLGGNSLLAVQLVSRLNAQAARRLTLNAVLQAPVIAQLAELVGHGSPAAQSLLLIRPGTTGTPVFFVHDGFGEAIIYHSLGQHLPASSPVYALQPLASRGAAMVHTRITEMAASYIAEIRRVQPDGPYLLGGLCAGGVIAFEMACQLQREGETIGMVALIEANDPSAHARMGQFAARQVKRFAEAFRAKAEHADLLDCVRHAGAFAGSILALLGFQIRARAIALHGSVQARLLRRCLARGGSAPAFLKATSVQQLYAIAEREHVPGEPLRGDVLLFRATRGNGDINDEPLRNAFSDPLLGWRTRVLGSVQVLDVPGGHYSLLQDPHVAAIAERIADSIAHAKDAAPPEPSHYTLAPASERATARRPLARPQD